MIAKIESPLEGLKGHAAPQARETRQRRAASAVAPPPAQQRTCGGSGNAQKKLRGLMRMRNKGDVWRLKRNQPPVLAPFRGGGIAIENRIDPALAANIGPRKF